MSADIFEVEPYLARIGLTGPREPSLATLRAIVAQHAAAIPFENIDVFLGRGVSLDIAALSRKMLANRRGGYCHEHNVLLRDALSALGYRVTGLLAHVVRGQDPSAMTPRTHMTLCVDLPEGMFIADVGYGNLTPTAPLALVGGMVQQTQHEQYRLMTLGDEWLLQAKTERFGGLYRFDLHPQVQADFEVATWFTSTHPGSVFVNNLVVARPGEGCRLTLFNNRFAVRLLDGRMERRVLAGADDLRATLADAFGLHLGDDDFAALAAKVEQRAAAGGTHPYFA